MLNFNESFLICSSGWADGFGNPVEVVCRAGCDGQGDYFGDFVGVQTLYLGFQFGETTSGRLDDEQEFLGGLYSSLPAVN